MDNGLKQGGDKNDHRNNSDFQVEDKIQVKKMNSSEKDLKDEESKKDLKTDSAMSIGKDIGSSSKSIP